MFLFWWSYTISGVDVGIWQFSDTMLWLNSTSSLLLHRDKILKFHENFMMIGKVENIELKSVILVKPNSGNGRLWHYNSATQSRLHIKLGRVVDPIKTHILCENQEFFYKLYDTVAKKLQNSLKIRQCWICLEILNRSLDSVIKILLFKLSSILSNSLQNGISLKI